jgi:two-component system CitB family sensor kinase
LDPASRLDLAEVDQIPIVTVLGNLIDNAVDAVAGSAATAGLHPRGAVTVCVTDSDGVLSLSVADTGPGIEPERLPEVFVDGYSTKEPRMGMRRGVGLALAHRLVTRVGGRITASSPGGALFEVTMPLRVRENQP